LLLCKCAFLQLPIASNNELIKNFVEISQLIEREKLMKKKEVVNLIYLLILFSFILTGCNGTSIASSTATSEPTTGTIKGKILRDDGNPLVDWVHGETGYLILICSENNNTQGECLHEEDMQKDISEIVASICETSDWSPNCKLHHRIGAYDLGLSIDGSYIFLGVNPGKYDLLLILISNGIAASIELINVDPVQAGKTVEYNFQTGPAP